MKPRAARKPEGNPIVTTTTTTTTGLAAELDRAGVLVFTYPDHMTAEQRERAAARMSAQWAALVAGARAERASLAVTR